LRAIQRSRRTSRTRVAERVDTLAPSAHMEDNQVELVIEGVLEALDVPRS
jgi:hypothetical protein